MLKLILILVNVSVVKVDMPRWDNKTDLERFEDKYIPVTESGCWLWIANSVSRYGYFYFPNYPNAVKSGMVEAHRASLWLYRNILVPSDKEVLHICDVTICCNPDHLKIGTHKENMEDMVNKGRCSSGRLKLTEEVVLQILKHPEDTKTTAKHFSIDSGYCSRLRNFKVKKWRYLKELIG